MVRAIVSQHAGAVHDTCADCEVKGRSPLAIPRIDVGVVVEQDLAHFGAAQQTVRAICAAVEDTVASHSPAHDVGSTPEGCHLFEQPECDPKGFRPKHHVTDRVVEGGGAFVICHIRCAHADEAQESIRLVVDVPRQPLAIGLGARRHRRTEVAEVVARLEKPVYNISD